MGSARQPTKKAIGYLHRLPFGDHCGSVIETVDQAEEHFRSVVPTLKSFCSLEEDRKFIYKYAGMSLNRISMAATSGLKLNQACGLTEDYILTIPMEDCGDSNCSIDGTEYIFSAKRNECMFFAPSESRSGLANRRSAITIRFSQQALNEMVSLITGDPNVEAVTHSRKIVLRDGAYSELQYLRKVLESIDALGLDVSKANILAIDDVILRFVVIIIFPQYFSDVYSFDSSSHRDAVDLICDAIRSRISSPLSLSEMQILSGLNARNLQRKFWTRFGCSPIAWQIRERLYYSRQQLMTATDDIKISDLALRAGFSSTSRFIACYKRAFDETPRQTLWKRSIR